MNKLRHKQLMLHKHFFLKDVLLSVFVKYLILSTTPNETPEIAVLLSAPFFGNNFC